MPARLILFGAFDRHNFGDLLFPHVVSRLLPPHVPCEFAGLVARDLRDVGGHRVVPLASIEADENTVLVHGGGELLTCSAYEAAVMLQDEATAAEAIARYDAEPVAAARWAASVLHTHRGVPYVARPPAGQVIFNAIGGVEWSSLSPAQQVEVLEGLSQARSVSVRDHLTQSHLRAHGIMADLCPDPGVMVKACFDEVLQRHRQQGEVAETIRSFPDGYLACQFSAAFADDATLDTLAQQLARVQAESGLGLVLFRAGAAPWHDRLEPYERLITRLPERTARRFRSLHLWDICALIASSRGFCGSSLHGTILAMAHALPIVGLIPPQHGDRPSKVAAYLETWGGGCALPVERFNDVSRMLRTALGQGAIERERRSAALVACYRASQESWVQGCLARQG